MTQEEFLKLNQFRIDTQFYVDGIAVNKGYNNGVTCVSYVNSANPTWKLDAETFIAWRDAFYDYATNIENQVVAGTIPWPSFDEFIQNSPQITWP